MKFNKNSKSKMPFDNHYKELSKTLSEWASKEDCAAYDSLTFSFQQIPEAVEILQRGGLVAIPTETVYGLGADASNPEALRKIFQAKGRPVDHPLIVHIADISQLNKWSRDISAEALILAKHFWPGPITLILKKAPNVSDLVTGGQDTIGLRVPNHPVALALLKEFGGGIAAPSANRFGRISPTTAEAVKEELGDKVDLILEGGACDVGVESTIVDVSGAEVVILRPGMINGAEISNVLGHEIATFKKEAPRVSGSLESHYAPQTKLVLVDQNQIGIFLQNLTELPAVLVTTHSYPEVPNIDYVLMPNDPHNYAHDLYQTLRNLDKRNFKLIMVEKVPETAAWAAVKDRLTRAAAVSD